MKKIIASALVAGIALLAVLQGCKSSSDDDHSHADGGHTSEFPSCQAIIDKCHPLDVGDEGDIHDCHELAHDTGTEEGCAQKKDFCFKACVPDAGAADAATGG